MKKLFKVLILFAVALTLFACNKKNNPTDNTNKGEEKEKTTASAIELDKMPIENFEFHTIDIVNGNTVKSEDFYKEKQL